MTARRRLLRPVLRGSLVAVVALGVAGCEKSTPFASVYASGDSVHSEAAYYCFDGECATFEHPEEIVVAEPGEKVLVEVGKAALEHGWLLQLVAPGGQGQTSQKLTESTFAFTAPNLEGQQVVIRVVSNGPSGEEQDRIGEWRFRLSNTPLKS